ncbi:MAG TPA: hypothetical protein PKE47_13020 [Verrucomicrobiota bacterium]|nr:hypothetical protein [Verrucomicrobiota bacterium]
MNCLFAAAENLLELLDQSGWKSCLIGGLANLRWGEPRQTKDVDVSVAAGWGREDEIADLLLSHYRLRLGDRAFALRMRVLLLLGPDDVPLDVALGAIPFELACIERSTPWLVLDRYRLRTCSAEDLIVHKVFAGRDRDWVDVEGVVRRQGSRLELELIRRELPPLLELKDAGGHLARFEQLVAGAQKRFRHLGDDAGEKLS